MHLAGKHCRRGVFVSDHGAGVEVTVACAVTEQVHIDVAALIKHCNGCLADDKVPRHVVVEPEPLPKLATFKLSKPAVRGLG